MTGSHLFRLAYQRMQKKRFEDAYLHIADQLSKLLAAGLPIEEAINYLRGKQKSRDEQLLLQEANEALHQGEQLAEVWRPLLSPLAVIVLQTGERAGRLPEVMGAWVDDRRSHREWLEKVVKVSSYPLLLLAGNLAVQFLVAWFVIPEFRSLYSTVQSVQSGSSQRLMAVVQALPLFELLFFILIITGVILLLWVRKHSAKIWGRLRKIVPGRRLIWTHRTQRFCTLLGLLLDSGLPILDALSELENCSGPNWISFQCEKIRPRLLAGFSLSEAFTTDLDPLLPSTLGVAAETGDLAAAVNETGSYLQKDIVRSMDSFVNWIEPILIIFLGSMVAVTMYTLFVPMYQLASSIATGSASH